MGQSPPLPYGSRRLWAGNNRTEPIQTEYCRRISIGLISEARRTSDDKRRHGADLPVRHPPCHDPARGMIYGPNYSRVRSPRCSRI